MKFYGYKKCSTCRQAETFLKERGVSFDYIDITDNPPSKTELKKILQCSGYPIKKLFNISGQIYRQMGQASESVEFFKKACDSGFQQACDGEINRNTANGANSSPPAGNDDTPDPAQKSSSSTEERKKGTVPSSPSEPATLPTKPPALDR